MTRHVVARFSRWQGRSWLFWESYRLVKYLWVCLELPESLPVRLRVMIRYATSLRLNCAPHLWRGMYCMLFVKSRALDEKWTGRCLQIERYVIILKFTVLYFLKLFITFGNFVGKQLCLRVYGILYKSYRAIKCVWSQRYRTGFNLIFKFHACSFLCKMSLCMHHNLKLCAGLFYIFLTKQKNF